MDLNKIGKENKELIELAEIPFAERTEEETKRIYELIDFQKDKTLHQKGVDLIIKCLREWIYFNI